MRVEIINNNQLDITDEKIVEIVNYALNVLNKKTKEIEIIFVSESEIQKLNIDHRKIDKSTDVLSFPQPKISNTIDKTLGSIVICARIVKQKNEEMADVVKHGLLHLLGRDHETNEIEWNLAAKKINCNL
jgi:probable rRNA maturation factor